jgi:hypothetical protein
VDDQAATEDEQDEAEATESAPTLIGKLFSYAFGCLFGRWDTRLAIGERNCPVLPAPFDPLPIRPPGMLTGTDKLPAKESPPGHPLRIEWDGITVDDPDHASDIVRRVREVLELIWKDWAGAIEKEACDIRQEDLISELRDFDDKLRRAANLHLEPDLNDGVVLNIALLHELVPWKEAKKYWVELLEGKYEWSAIGKQLRQNGVAK